MLELVCNEIVEQGGHVQWNDIAGQDQAKRLVQELVVWPMLNPHLFKVWPPHSHLHVTFIVYSKSA
jgi:SpoVK/Ycf46/Vps4 family AAA+-type ATPase